ncbi:hypothetical protein DFJ74DRAFT_685205 [Hyaloraphidium curvatum]|nr:hypothetical protein DFJ74DRAFT_685205 [Hyaloraphidium curvatum]
MVQGGLKKAPKASSNSSNHKKPKKGRVIAPKNPSLIQKQKLDKKLSATINRNIEGVMLARAGGHLTILKNERDATEETAKKGKAKP